jgi:ribosomal protein L18
LAQFPRYVNRKNLAPARKKLLPSAQFPRIVFLTKRHGVTQMTASQKKEWLDRLAASIAAQVSAGTMTATEAANLRAAYKIKPTRK